MLLEAMQLKKAVWLTDHSGGISATCVTTYKVGSEQHVCMQDLISSMNRCVHFHSQQHQTGIFVKGVKCKDYF